MIPDHLVNKAVHAAGENWALTSEWEHDKLHAQVHAALEAVAADIWDEGYHAGFSDGPFICACSAWNDSECACGNYGNGLTPEPNPYPHEETKHDHEPYRHARPVVGRGRGRRYREGGHGNQPV